MQYKVNDIIYWVYAYSSVFPNFYKVTKVTEQSIFVVPVPTIHTGITAGFASSLCTPDTDHDTTNQKPKRIARSKDGNYYFKYCGYKQNLHLWTGEKIASHSD